jgi:hypothetical protein
VFPLIFPRLTLALTAFDIADDLVREYFEKGFSLLSGAAQQKGIAITPGEWPHTRL